MIYRKGWDFLAILVTFVLLVIVTWQQPCPFFPIFWSIESLFIILGQPSGNASFSELAWHF
jgi:hypothetical protein